MARPKSNQTKFFEMFNALVNGELADDTGIIHQSFEYVWPILGTNEHVRISASLIVDKQTKVQPELEKVA